MSAASEITRKAKSNLAVALRVLPRERREDMTVFYAFCRTVDDIADAPDVPAAERADALDRWENGLTHGFATPDELQRELLAVRDRRGIPNDLLVAIIDGCRMDLSPRLYRTWDELAGYTWKVACAVGLVSIRLFGCTDPQSERHAVALGHALQLTNILRDVGEDLHNGGRIYLPLEDLDRFGITPEELRAGHRPPRFAEMMAHQADRAEAFYREAAATIAPADRRALLPARLMAAIYHHLLAKMRADGFRVLDKRYRISKVGKLAILSHALLSPSA